MNHKTNVNTTEIGSQANIAKNPLVLEVDHSVGGGRQAHDSRAAQPAANAAPDLRGIDMHADDIEAHALAAQTLCEICFEEIDSCASNDPDVVRTMLRLDALLKAVYRNAVLVQEASDVIGALALEGGAA